MRFWNFVAAHSNSIPNQPICQKGREKRRLIDIVAGPLDRLSRFHGYLPAFGAFLVALALHWVFVALIGQNFAGIFFVYLAAMLIGGWCGYLPGLIVVLLVVIVPPWLFTPDWSPRNINPSGVSILLLVSLMVSRAAHTRRTAEAFLQRRVQEKTAELAAANEALQRHVAELLRANADLEQFAYSASHDLQEPLRMVSIFTQLLQQRYAGKLDQEADEYIRYAVNGAQRMQTLITGLQSYITITATEEASELVDSAAAVRRAMESLHIPIAQTGARIEFEELPCVSVHKIHLEQLFQNLISNAIKYRNQDIPLIRISAAPDGAVWRFTVRDNGIGIDQQFSEQIFGVFARLHRHDEYEGSGIGLAICKKIVERYGGRIWVESTPGKGSAFCFILPGG